MVLNLGGGFVVPEWFFILFLLYILYYAISVMTIAKKTGTEHGWMVFIPGLFPFVEARIAGVPLVSAFIYVVILGYLVVVTHVSLFLCTAGAKCINSYIQLIGIAILVLLQLWWWVKIAEKCGKSSFYGILYAVGMLLAMLPLFGSMPSTVLSIILGTIVLSVFAWRTAPLQDTKEEEAPEEKQQPQIPPNMRPPDPQRKH